MGSIRDTWLRCEARVLAGASKQWLAAYADPKFSGGYLVSPEAAAQRNADLDGAGAEPVVAGWYVQVVLSTETAGALLVCGGTWRYVPARDLRGLPPGYLPAVVLLPPPPPMLAGGSRPSRPLVAASPPPPPPPMRRRVDALGPPAV